MKIEFFVNTHKQSEIIDITENISFEPVTKYDIIELDKLQWMNDKRIKKN